MSVTRLALAVTALLFFAVESSAESIPDLNADNIQRFLQSMDEVEKLGEKYGAKEDAEREIKSAKKRYGAMAQGGMMQGPSNKDIERAAAPFSSGLPEMHKSGGFDEMLATVKRHGFSSVEQWAGIGDKAIRAYAATQMEGQMPKMNEQMKEAKAKLANSGMSAKQQAAMLEMMGAGSTMMKAFDDVPAADKKAIEPFIPQFEKLQER